jgi:hypothetical protein
VARSLHEEVFMKSAHEIVNNSGYPLQIRLKEWIEETYLQHRWKTLVGEHRWVNAETKDDGYIDLVLEKSRTNLRLVIECKRIDGSWTFLLPVAHPALEREVIGLSAIHSPARNYSWNEIYMVPESLKAAFCVMETDGKKDSRTLEKLARELLLSLEHLSVEEAGILAAFINRVAPTPDVRSSIFYLPVIVTTANLQTMAFPPSAVDVKTGNINSSESTVSSVEYIRFQKNLATTIKNESDSIYSLADVNRNNDRTVFVVQAESFINFLSRISML